MFVDWNGDVLFCSNDWGREHIVGNLLKGPLSKGSKYNKEFFNETKVFSPLSILLFF